MKEINKLMVHELEQRLIELGIKRINQCLSMLSEEQIHYVPNTNSNSINNQILHLDGNIRQWLIASFTDVVDNRNRDSEFDSNNKKTKEELIKVLNDLEEGIRSVFPYVLESDLTQMKDVQCYNESLLSILVHVIEHFSYHLGQITYITKMVLDIDTGYYKDADLNKVNN